MFATHDTGLQRPDDKGCKVRDVVEAVQRAGELLRLFDDAVARIADDQQDTNE